MLKVFNFSWLVRAKIWDFHHFCLTWFFKGNYISFLNFALNSIDFMLWSGATILVFDNFYFDWFLKRNLISFFRKKLKNHYAIRDSYVPKVPGVQPCRRLFFQRSMHEKHASENNYIVYEFESHKRLINNSDTFWIVKYKDKEGHWCETW